MSERESLSAAASFGIDYARGLISGKRIVALTGAGISTDSGIPDYRGQGRVPKHPMSFDSFMSSEQARIRYWARSFVGWSRIADAKPNGGHLALAAAERTGNLDQIITQNVDGLHQAAGSKKVIDLHGRLDRVRCMTCGQIMSRVEMDGLLSKLNPNVSKDANFEFTPDGDAEVEATDGFLIPECAGCGGVLKPDVVFFGESVSESVANASMSALDAADALVVAGSSLTVNSGLRFVKRAHRAGKPVIIVNLGPTKGDDYASARIAANTTLALERLLNDL